MTHSTPATMTASLSGDGLVMNRVSTSMRADSPGWAGTFRSVNTPVTWGFLSGDRVPAAPGIPTKSPPTAPGLAHTRISLQAPEATAVRGATAATVSRKATTTESALARTNSPLRAASIPSAGLVDNTTPPAGGRVEMVEHGMDTSRAAGAPETSGAVMSPTVPSAAVPCGHRTVAVVWLTGSSGVSPHSTIPASPARTATSRAIRVESALSLGTSVDGRRRHPALHREQTQSVTQDRRVAALCVCSRRGRGQVGRSGAGLHSPLRVAVLRSRRAGSAFG
jgi:hypothetical protein